MLEVRQVTKRFGELVANDAISLSVAPGQVLALLGENGAGKSTLVSILFGQYRADSGAVLVAGRELPAGDTKAALAAGIGMVHQHFTLAENLSVLDNVMIGQESLLGWHSAAGHYREKLLQIAVDYGLAVTPDALVRDLSVGERQRVEILKALLRGAKYLILDEPTAVLTPGEAQALFATLKRFVAKGLAVIFISHKLGEVLAVSDQIIVLRAGRIVFESRTSNADADALALAMVGKRLAAIDRGGPPKAQALSEPIAITVPVLAIEGISAIRAGRMLIQDASLQINSAEIVAIAGVAGNGQQALADLLCGLLPVSAGSITLAGASAPKDPRAWIDAGVARIPEDRLATGVIADLSLAENAIAHRHRNLSYCRWPRSAGWLQVLDLRKMRQHAQAIISQFDVRCSGVEQTTRTLSGGNIQKFILGRELANHPQLVIANQPTWGLDVGAVNYVHRQLLAVKQRGAAVLLISEDLDEVFTIADRIAVIFQGRLGPALPAARWSQQQIGLTMAGNG